MLPPWVTFELGREFVLTLEEMCMAFCRHASQADMEKVEAWPFDLLFCRWRALMRVLEKENEAQE